MVKLDLKNILIGFIIGLCTITLIANENKENTYENFVGRYRIFESKNNSESFYLIDTHNGKLFIWDKKFEHWDDFHSELNQY
tara:strand:+ start:82 stop:327 length:246 start_codon:yes stop_codon:yes gene_type:complete